tara:strand:+ start:3304 stop:3690 length:387 start_codon:yes stop_codon:yes gene_type:complete
MNNKIDLTQFEGHGFREAITQNRHEYEEGFPPATVEPNIPEGITFAPPPLGERLVSWGGHKVWMSDKDANVIQHIDGLIAELKRCYEEIDKITRLVDDFSHRCEQAEYTDVGEVWDLLNALIKNFASE